MQAVCISNGLDLTRGPFLFALTMTREINAEAGDRLDLKDTAAHETPDALALLEAAYAERLAQIGGRATMLEPVVQIATEHGYTGSVAEAAGLLRAAGYRVIAGHDGRLVVWRAA